MSPGEALIPIIMFLTVGAILAGVILTRHRERMTIIEKGLRPEDMKALYERSTQRPNPLSALKWGMVFLAIGLAVLAGMVLRDTYFVDEAVYPGLIALLGGLGLIAFYVIAGRRKSG